MWGPRASQLCAEGFVESFVKCLLSPLWWCGTGSFGCAPRVVSSDSSTCHSLGALKLERTWQDTLNQCILVAYYISSLHFPSLSVLR